MPYDIRPHLPPGITIGDVSDGYHTFDELYAHRHALFLALCQALGAGWKSLKHADGTYYEGWFLAGIDLPGGGQIAYHLPLTLWKDAAHLITLDKALPWDGHTPAEAVTRLLAFAASRWPNEPDEPTLPF